MEEYIKKIKDYVSGYNNMNVSLMLKHLHTDVVFTNVTNGIETLKIVGKRNFQLQAEETIKYFSKRQIKITSHELIEDNLIMFHISYEATLARDISDKLKSGSKMKINGKSIFQFKDKLIISIKDIC